jgi:hypothetical protein
VYGNAIVVGTTGQPYILQGVEPGALQSVKLEQKFACVSARSMCEIDGGVIYASPDGLVLVTNAGAVLITEPYLDPLQWAAYKPASMHCVWWRRRIVVFFDTGSRQGSLVLEPNKEPSEFDLWSTAAWVDPRSDELYIAQNGSVMRVDSGAPIPYVWRSKIFRTRPTNAGAARVHANGPVTFRLFADEQLRFTKNVLDDRPFSLPAGYQARDWAFELEGTAEVFSFAVAHTMSEFKTEFAGG